MVTSDLFAQEPSNSPTSSAEGSRARTSQSRVLERVSMASAADYGRSSPELWARFDRATSSWRTSELSLLGDSPLFSETLPRSGMTRSGTLYRLRPLTRLIYASASGSSRTMLPTPTAGDANGSGSRNTPTSNANPGVSLTDWARGDGGMGRKMLPTPTATEYGTQNNGTRADGTTFATAGAPSLFTMARRGLLPTPRAAEYKGTGPIGSASHSHRLSRGYLDATMQERSGASGQLSPRFVEWMMGFPDEWTAIDSTAWATLSSRKLRKSSGEPS